ncbi:response regulator [Caenimonas aquaedulcis]|uniref:Response regulator transcription factor n=1 Tax=Caenimonas aquaedulcis TaxID=2793270 RepID=A0A931H526_9BURK|nr:response regulator [Caenimonas aquaedulcis]MBG9388627.1 response regulator transcription factor [Caenimonas aquaedulcis]
MEKRKAVRVFLVEDMNQLKGVIEDLLRSMGNFVVVASAGTEAEAILWLTENQGKWDLAVVDLVLEQGTGMGVIARTKGRPSASKVVVFSDYVTEGISKYCLKLGADAAIPKSDMPAFMEFCGALA